MPASETHPSLTDGLPDGPRQKAILVLMLGIALAVLDGTLLNLALPGIARDLRVSAADSIWVVNAYQLATLALLLPCSALGDRIGHRQVYLGGAVIFSTASLGCFLSESLGTLIAARVLQGLGAAGIMSVNSALLRQIFPVRLLGRGIALNSAMVATFSVAGPTVAAGILAVASWPWLFAINLPLGILVVALGWRTLPRPPRAALADTRLSPLDVLLNALLFSLLFLGSHELGMGAVAQHRPGAWPLAIAMLAGAAVVAVVYLRRQWHQSAPLFPVDLLRIPVFALSMCTSVSSFTAQTLAYIAMPFLMLEGWGYSPVQAAMLITAWPAALVVTAPVAGRLIGRYPSGLLGGIGLGLMALGLLLLALLPGHPPQAAVIACMALCGVGFALFQSPNNHTIVTSPPPQRTGAAGGMLGSARLTGQSLGAVILALIFSIAGADTSRGPLLAILVAAGFAAVGAVFSSLRLRHAPAPR